jgi:YidC/Oxa1 family membrane protein insertase
MNQKKIIRIFLYVALAFIGITLWSDWQKENMPSPQNTPQLVANQTSNIVPAFSSANNHVDTIQPQQEKTIQVKTDVLDLSINTLGGEITQINLPQYPLQLHSTQPYQLLNDDEATHYTAESGLKGFIDGPIQYQVPNTNYVLDKNQKSLAVILHAVTQQGVEINKIFTFYPNNYLVNVSYQITNNTTNKLVGNYYMQISRTNLAPPKEGTVGLTPFYGFAMSTPDTHYQSFKFSHLNEDNVNQFANQGWFAMVEHYFITAWIPNTSSIYHYYSSVSDNGVYHFDAESPTFSIDPGKTLELNSQFYSGPKISSVLDTVAPHLSMTINYGWLWPISIVIFWLMKHIHMIIGNWGWSIVIVTALIKLVFWKPSAMSYKSMAAMRGLQPKLAALKERCGDDKQSFSKEMMALYKKEKVNPLGGCLPMLIQIPFFIALYWVLIASVELRQAPFMLWIHDLAAKDPYYILPVIMGATMLLQQKLSPPPPDPTQAKVMMFLPVFMTAIFINFPAGLVLYMVVNNALSIGQQYWITKQYEAGAFKKEKKDSWKRAKNKK